jgi:hypothetical protein
MDDVLLRARRLLGDSLDVEYASLPVDGVPRMKNTYKASVISGSTLVNTHEVRIEVSGRTNEIYKG